MTEQTSPFSLTFDQNLFRALKKVSEC